MKAKGLVWCAAVQLSLVLAPAGFADNDDELPSVVNTALATDSYDENVQPVVFERMTAASRDPFCYGSVEMMFLDINADTGGRITASFNDNTTPGTEISFDTGTGVQDAFGVGARTVLGRQFSNKWGMAARYFHLEDTETGVPRLTPGTTPLPNFGTYTETDTLKMYSIDLEAVRSFNPGKTKIDTTFGARHASLDVDSLFHAFGVITTGNFVNLNLSNGCAFDGTGITSAMTFRRQIGDSCASLFIGGRGSKMWNHTDSFGRSAGTIVSNPSTPLSGAATVTRNNAASDLVIWEGSAGVHFEFELRAPLRL